MLTSDTTENISPRCNNDLVRRTKTKVQSDDGKSLRKTLWSSFFIAKVIRSFIYEHKGSSHRKKINIPLYIKMLLRYQPTIVTLIFLFIIFICLCDCITQMIIHLSSPENIFHFQYLLFM